MSTVIFRTRCMLDPVSVVFSGDVTVQMIGTEVCIPTEDDAEIGSWCVKRKGKAILILDSCVDVPAELNLEILLIRGWE
jgi:hypothetical protein